MHLLTNVTIDEAEVSAVFSSLRGLSLIGIVKILVLAIVLVILVKLLTRVAYGFIEKSRIDKSLHGFLRNFIRIVLYFIAVMILAGSLHIDVTSLIAVLSVAGLALSLALQGALSNLASGIVILASRPFHVGDYVAIGGDEGHVEEINMTYTKLATFDRRIIYIPNSTVTGSNVTNYTIEGKRRVDLVISAAYEADVDLVKKTLVEAIDEVPQFQDSHEKFARVSAYLDNGIQYTVRAWCRTEDYWDAYFGLIESIKRTFDRNGIKMSYTNLNVHVISEK